MKRRKALGTILITGGATAIGLGSYQWYSLSKIPDKNYLLNRKPLLADLAETIIPATDTPGAKEAGAIEYMMHLLSECTDSKTLNRFVKGLQDLEEYCESQFHKGFSECSSAEKDLVLQRFDQSSENKKTLLEKVKDKYTGYGFFEILKEYTVYSYCISEKGASLGMRYIAVPGRYLSCVPLEPNQKAWATK
jgi:Gluconate 2-dehydrogenase subunit 3